jgi:hypothetical protein
LFTHQELSCIVSSTNRQASSNHFESFVSCGRDFLDFLKRKRKVNDEVVSIVLDELWINDTEKKLPKLLPSVGSKKIEKTNNA